MENLTGNDAESLTHFGQTLLNPLAAILGMTQTLQQQTLSPEQQHDYIQHVNHLCQEMIILVNHFIEQTHHIKPIKEMTLTHLNDEETNSIFANLKNLHALIVGDDTTLSTALKTEFQALGLICSTAETDQALNILHTAQNSNNPYQIVIFCNKHFDHHFAYIGRTIRANPLLNNLMSVLALPTPLLAFETEQVYFSGFSCILNLAKPERVAKKLANSWHSWSAKLDFVTHSTNDKMATKNHILLVEDDPIPQKVTMRQLAELGYQVDTANDGHSALKLLEKKSYDLIFMDIGLPDISGLEVTAEIRKREHNDIHVPIVGLTMHALGSEQESGLQAGMNEYIVKPLLQERLKTVLKQWIK